MSTDPTDDHGFVAVPAWIAESRVIPSEGKLAYLMLATYNGMTVSGESAESFAHHVGMDFQSFRRGVQSLIYSGAVKVDDNGVIVLAGTSIGISE